jgi:organic hydroperoxide reductase OsmC/OhrA
MSKQHDYGATIVWTGDRGQGTNEYRGYDRTWEVRTPGKPVIRCSNDPLLGGDPSRPNPEDLLLASLSACHMLWYLHLACNAGIVVMAYEDAPVGIGETSPNGAGRFLRVTLRPSIRLRRGVDLARADAIHHEVHEYCFIARSVNFPVAYEATYVEV